ncbi:hypothetical protein VaNZ11_010478 [Volvox africanus]|uniref:BTB domain-containing protein n=1 Tax=Volvox africanus TaxID=51714 RepID=A0ABQ5S9P9_9CHLO|nr:hypothetical protein VaNZ11_010478 [Volvox africanus]
MNISMALWLQGGFSASLLFSTLAYSLILVAVINAAFAYRRLSSTVRPIPEFCHVNRMNRCLCIFSKLFTALHPHAEQQSHQVPATQTRLLEDNSLKKLVNNVVSIADTFNLDKLEAVLAAWVEEGFQESARVEAMCNRGLADSLDSILSRLTRLLSGEQASGNADPSGKALGAACLQVSWLLVQLASGSMETRRALARGITAAKVAAFMGSVAPVELLAPVSGSHLAPPAFARLSADSIDLRASSSGQGPPESGNTNYRSPPAGSITNNHIILQQQQQQIRSLLMPGSLVDAVLRNCSWCLLMLCDVGGPRSAAAPPQDGHSDTSSAPAVEMGDMKLGDVELALVYSRELLRKPHSAPLSTSGGDSSDGLPADVLARIVQSWDGLEASVTAAAVLACITCLVDLDAELAQRASNLLLASPTFGNMCEALCRAGAADESVLTSTSGPVGISERAVSGTGTGANLYGIFGMAATAAPHVVPSRCLTRACAVLSQFLSRTLSQPQSAGFLLRQAVADHAVGWLLHASTLPLALRQQLLRQLLGTEGHGAISPPAAQLVDAPLALCHIISAPPACHSLLAPDVAVGYLLAAAPFGSSTVQPPSQPGALPAFGAVADGHLGQQQQQNVNNQAPFMIGDDDAWEPDAALLGAQALGGPQPVDVLMDIQGDDLWVGGDAPGNMAADVFLGVGAAIAAPPDGLAVDLHIPAGAHTATAAEVERHVSTLAVACRLLLASCRLENAFRAFLSDLCATGRVALKRRSLRNCAPIDMGYARRGSLDGRLLELEPSMTHHGTATAPWSSNDSSSGGGRFGGGSGTVRESGASFLLPSSSSNGLSRGGAAAWSLPMSGNCAGDVGGEGIGASGSTWPEARSTLDQAGVEGTRGSWCWHSVDAAMMGAAPAGCSGGGSSHSAVCAGSGAGAASVATAAIASFPAAEGCSQPATYACRRSAYALDPRADLSREAPGSSGGGTVNGSDKAFHGAALSGSLRLQSPIVALTDVMAGVAGLIDAMLWRSPSLGGERCHRGGFMDHYDSMSESDSTMYANHERHSTDGGGARGSAGLLQVPADVERTAWRAAAPWSVGAISSGRIRLSLSAGEFDPCGTNARAVGPQDIDAGKGSCHFGDSQSRIRSSGQVAYSTERSDSGSRLCRQNKLLQGPNSHAAAAVGALRLRQGSSSTADRAASYDLGGGAITENVEDEQGEQPQRLEMQQQEMQLFEKDGSCTHLESATAHVAVATWLGLPAPDRNTQRLRPECVYGATPVSPERLDAESGSSSVLYRRTNMMECVESGDRGSCDNCYSMPQPSFSKHAFCEITNAPATDDAEDDVARASEAGIRGAYGAMESEFPTMTNPSSWLLSAGMPRLSHMAMDNGSDNLTNYDITSRSDPRRSAVGQSRCSGRHGEGAMSAAKSMSAAAPTLSSSLTCEHERTSTGSSNASQLPPYTYFGSTQLTAEALALPEDVATMVTSMLSATGGSSNSTAGRIAIAAAAAAAAAATASSAGAAGATTAATTLAASAASAKPVARLGKGTAAPMNTSGEGHWSAHLHNACGFASRGESESDTQFAVDTGVADGNDEDTGINPPVPEGSPCLNGNGNGHVRPDRQGSHAFSWRRFPAFHTRIWRGFTASRATAADSSAPAPSSAVMAQCDVGGIGDSHGACDGMQEASPCRSAMVDLTSSGIDCVVTGPHAGPTAYLDRTFDAATRPPVMAGPSALLPMPVNSQAEASVRQVVPMEMAIAGGDAMVIPEATAPFPWVEDNSFEAHGVKGCITRENVGAAAGLECPFAAQETCDPISSGRPGTGSQAHPVLPMPVSATAAAAAMPGDDTRIPGVPLAALRSTVGLVAEDKVAVFAFGNEQVEVPSRALRTLRRCSPLLYSWLSRLPDFTKPITILQVPGLDDSSNCRVFLQLLAWAQGIRDVEQLLLPLQQPSQQQQQQLLSPPQQQQQCKGSLPCDAAVSPASAVSPSNVTNTDWPLVMSHEGGVEPLEQLWQLWRAADYLQVDELLTAVEDELARRFTLPPPNGPAAWAAALSLAGSQQHFLGATSRLAKLCALHFMRGVWGILGDEELLIAAGVGAGVLGPAVAAEVRDRLVALVALADLDMSGGE